jgi:hypothetical protein
VLGLAREGWRRGFVFFAIDLVGFVVAVIAAVRLHEIPGALYDGLGVSSRWSSILGGLTIFVPIIVVVAIVGGRLSKGVYKPGLWATNRVLGIAFGAGLGIAVITVGLIAARVVELPLGLTGLIERSPIGNQVVAWTSPAVGAVDDALDLGLCDGRLASSVEEACSG